MFFIMIAKTDSIKKEFEQVNTCFYRVVLLQ